MYQTDPYCFIVFFNSEDNEVDNSYKQSESHMGKVLISKPRMDKMKTGQTIGGLSVIIPKI